MWKIGSSPNDPATLATLLDQFSFWTMLRVVCVDASFLSVLGAMTSVALLSAAEGVDTPAGGVVG